MKWRAGILLTILLYISGCTPSSIERSPSERSSLAVTQHLVSKYGTYPTNGFLLRLVSNLKKAMKMNDAVSISILSTNHDIAASTEAGQILISQGLLINLTSEAQLAFVLAHELSHIKLNHFDITQSSDLEAEADKLALYTVYRAGYEVKAALKALRMPYNHTSIHLSTLERLKSLEEPMKSIPISSYGVVDTEEAKEFRKTLYRY